MIPKIESIAIIPIPENYLELMSDLWPSIVKVFPAPVMPYAIHVTLNPSNKFGIKGEIDLLNTSTLAQFSSYTWS